MRHAQAIFAANDLLRSLSAEGEESCQEQAEHLQAQNQHYDAIVTSPATRTVSTALIVAKALAYPFDQIQTIPTLYNADEKTLLTVIHDLNATWNTVLLIGHNPGLSHLARTLTADDLRDLEPAEIYGISFQARTWIELEAGQGKKEFMI